MQGGTQAAGTASLGAQHTGPEAQGPEDELQRARKMFAERRRLAEEKAATAGPAPFVFASGAGSNGLALRPSAKGPAQGAAADGPDAVKSTQPAAAKQLQNGLQHDIGNGFATSSQPSEDSIQGSLLQVCFNAVRC